ncbi:hypothetical protein D8771_17475 [Streptomyces albus]|uniref:Uncharacterized protein n=1 Tax=Streptomyces albus TaxID=1888 RepID=A0A8H1QQ19_9ACTN|nr:hypothetical protein D8771_17475 [Streptomyces albus]
MEHPPGAAHGGRRRSGTRTETGRRPGGADAVPGRARPRGPAGRRPGRRAGLPRAGASARIPCCRPPRRSRRPPPRPARRPWVPSWSRRRCGGSTPPSSGSGPGAPPRPDPSRPPPRPGPKTAVRRPGRCRTTFGRPLRGACCPYRTHGRC